jgi:subtilisin family serine protease
VPAAVLAQSKVDSFLRVGKIPAKTTSYRAESSVAVDGLEKAEVFVKSRDPAVTAGKIKKLGGQVHMRAGNILTANIAMSDLEKLAEMEDVEFIESGKPIQMKNDFAALDINSKEVHEGYNLPSPVTGKDVIIGIIDTGIDYDHADFKDAKGKSRILSIWNQTQSVGQSPSEIEDSYGTECGKDSIASGSCPLSDADGHGTHVAGTAAGRNDTYGGIAPDANIIVVSYDSSVDLQSGYAETIFSTKICQAAYYIFRKADEAGLPAVVNLSLGTHIGAHDGTSLFEECLGELIKGSAGRAIVAAAGNEYSTEEEFTGIHAGHEVNGAVATNFVIRKLTSDRLYYIDVWGSTGSDLSVGLAMHNGSPSSTPSKFSGLIEAGQSSSGTLMDGAIDYSINFEEKSSPLNGKPHAGIRIKVNSGVNDLSDKSFDLVVSGSGSFDAWLFPDKPSKTVDFTSFADDVGSDWTYVPGDRINNVAIPATSPDIIAVGAYTTRNEWDRGAGCCQVPFEIGNLLDFSSSGPTSDPSRTGVKPDIAAPGGMIASALSSDAVDVNDLMVMEDGKHALEAGTSMAAPFVTGTIALMFSADPNYTYEDAKKYIIQSAYADEIVGEAPNDRWGHGKLDVLATLETAINGGSSGHFDRNSNLNTPGDESYASKPSCQLLAGDVGVSKADVIIAMCLIGALGIIIVGRKIV